MNLKFEDEVERDLYRAPMEVKRRILIEIFRLEKEPLPENSQVIELLDGSEIQCLKLQKEDRNSELNHRVTYDIIEDEQIRVYGIFPREPEYHKIKEETRNRK